jgi:hypothetical protein
MKQYKRNRRHWQQAETPNARERPRKRRSARVQSEVITDEGVEESRNLKPLATAPELLISASNEDQRQKSQPLPHSGEPSQLLWPQAASLARVPTL